MNSHQFGPRVTADGTTFRLWAPAARHVDLVTDRVTAMTAHGDGWFAAHLAGAGAGTRYRFGIDQAQLVPDPASRFQPDDVHGPSEVIGNEFAWTANAWRGRPWHECVFLEAHVGAFTPQGTFRAMIERLDDLRATGITALELMPLADFAGRWNWGYDGVLPFAPDASYGRPEELKALIDAAHQRGLMVFLDVVYNHFGPEGNYLGLTAPAFFTDARTPWGQAIDYRVPQVRRFVVENALCWLDEFRFDGLRLDAVHAITEPGLPSVLREASAAAGRLAARTGRHIHLVLENDGNGAALLDPVTDPPDGRYRAQWNDDYHHAWHVFLSGESTGYYRDYAEPPRHLARCLAEGFAYQGEASAYRGGTVRGEKSRHLPPTAFVNFLQNHDQVGNRVRGERLTTLAPPAALEAALALTLLAPAPPLLFMGEEWGATEPFPFFCDFCGELADAVRQGRRSEFAEAYADHAGEIPDPLAEATFRLSKLDWSARDRPPHARRLALVQRLLAVRHDHVMPLLPGLAAGGGDASWHGPVLRARWEGATPLTLIANLSNQPAPAYPHGGTPIWGDASADMLAPWTVLALTGT